MSKRDCPFCIIAMSLAPAQVVKDWGDVLAIVPLNPVTPGHTLVLPTKHVRDATEFPRETARVMQCAAEFAQSVYPCNIITSAGAEATQTVMHLHIHVVPRWREDGLKLPWS